MPKPTQSVLIAEVLFFLIIVIVTGCADPGTEAANAGGDDDGEQVEVSGESESESESEPEQEQNLTPIRFIAVTFNTGSGGAPSDELPNEAYHSEQSAVSEEWYGNGLAWKPFVEAARRFLDAVDPDVVVFQEIFWSGGCPEIPAEARTGFVCEDWAPGDPVVAQTVLGDGWQVMCNPGKPDKCAGVNRRFGSFQGCDQDFCLEGMFGSTFEGCGKGARVGRGVIDLRDGGTLTLVNFHGSSGLNRSDQQCRVGQVEQVFIDLGDGRPAASGEHNLIMGDLNTDPGRFTADLSAIRWNDFVGDGKKFHYITAVGAETVPTYGGIVNIDHVGGDTAAGSCWTAGVDEGHPPVTAAGYFDHAPVVCTLQIPR